jgi:hypothetical protein
VVWARAINKHGRHRQFLFLIGRFKKSGFRGEDFFKSANQKQELPMAAVPEMDGRPVAKCD